MGVFEEVLSQTSRRHRGFGGVLERRREPRMPTVRATHAGLTSNLWELELLPAFGLERLATEIGDLSKRSVDRNIFFEPEVLLAAWPRLTSQLAPHGCWMLCLWETLNDTRQLRLFMPTRLSKVGFPSRPALQVLANEFMPIGSPLIDRECANEAVETLLRILTNPGISLPPVLDMAQLRKPSKTLTLFQQAADSLGLPAIECLTHERAALSGKGNFVTFADEVLGKKHRKEYSRQLRRLEDSGSVTLEVARNLGEVLDAFEGFMTLELRGWKGRRGTALYSQKRIAAFSRQIVAELACAGACEIFSLKQNGKAFAALIMLGRDGYLVPWKIAFDESLSVHSPGVQVMLKATTALLQRDDFVEADSLAVSNHWMINRLWRDRITITDLAIGLTPESTADVETLINAKERAAGFRQWAKRKLTRSDRSYRGFAKRLHLRG